MNGYLVLVTAELLKTWKLAHCCDFNAPKTSSAFDKACFHKIIGLKELTEMTNTPKNDDCVLKFCIITTRSAILSAIVQDLYRDT